jgi:hypothetical protein
MGITFLVCFVGIGLMFFALIKFELGAKRAAADLSRLERELAPDYEPQYRRTAAPTDLGTSVSMSADRPDRGGKL